MRSKILKAAVVVGLLGAWQLPASAQSGATPQQIQGLIAQGQENAALNDLQMILQSHPQSGVAWYLTAEAQDARGDEGAARDALAKADQYAPGLPFAQPNEVAALRAHLNGTGAPASGGAATSPAPAGMHISPIFVIGLFVVLFLLVRMFMRSRRRMAPGYPMNPGNPVGPYGPGGMPYGGGGMMGGQGGMMGGGGVGGSLLGGLAAGAGFAGGERIIDGMMGGNRGVDPNGNGNVEPGAGVDPGRDDGLQGSPGWGDNSGDVGNSGSIDSGGGFDPGNNW